MGMARTDTVVVVPVFNEDGTVAAVVADLFSVFTAWSASTTAPADASAEALAGRGHGAAARDQPGSGRCPADRVRLRPPAQRPPSTASRSTPTASTWSSTRSGWSPGRRRPAPTWCAASRFRGATPRDALACAGSVLRGGYLVHPVERPVSTSPTPTTDCGSCGAPRWGADPAETQPRMAYASELLSAIVPAGLAYVEEPVECLSTGDYSRTKGQRNINAVNILF